MPEIPSEPGQEPRLPDDGTEASALPAPIEPPGGTPPVAPPAGPPVAGPVADSAVDPVVDPWGAWAPPASAEPRSEGRRGVGLGTVLALVLAGGLVGGVVGGALGYVSATREHASTTSVDLAVSPSESTARPPGTLRFTSSWPGR